jgi:hypothetical protein
MKRKHTPSERCASRGGIEISAFMTENMTEPAKYSTLFEHSMMGFRTLSMGICSQVLDALRSYFYFKIRNMFVFKG